MEIKRTSWHFRWLRAAGYRPWQAHTLCDYLRTFFWCVLVHLAGLAGACLLACIVGFFLYLLVGAPVLYFFNLIPPWEDAEGIQGMAEISGFFWSIAAGICSAIGTFVLGKRGLRWLLEKRAMRKRLDSAEPSIIAQALKDLRDKACTRITFKD